MDRLMRILSSCVANIPPNFPHVFFDTSGRWAVVPYNHSLAFWPLNKQYPYVLHGESRADSVYFTPDGRQLVAGLRMWDITNPHASGRDLWKAPSEFHRIEFDASGNYAVVGTLTNGTFLISLSDGKVRQIPNTELQHTWTLNDSISPDGRYVVGTHSPRAWIHIWDVKTDQVRILNVDIDTSRSSFFTRW